MVHQNIHHSKNTQDIINSLRQISHAATNVWNIKQQRTNKPLPTFLVDLKQAANHKEIYNLKHLLNTVVAFEPPHVKNISPNANAVSVLDKPKIIVTTTRDV